MNLFKVGDPDRVINTPTLIFSDDGTVSLDEISVGNGWQYAASSKALLLSREDNVAAVTVNFSDIQPGSQIATTVAGSGYQEVGVEIVTIDGNDWRGDVNIAVEDAMRNYFLAYADWTTNPNGVR
jgi:hypothetical protein